MAFSLIDTDPTFRLVAAVDALSGDGKTRLACTAPAPNYVLSLDPNTASVVRQYTKHVEPGKKIYVEQFIKPMPALSLVSKAKTGPQDTVAQDLAIEQWNRFVDSIGALIAGVTPAPRTITIDTASEFRQMQMFAEFGKNIQIPMHLYTKPNLAYQNIFNTLKQELPTTNILLLHRLKDKYVDNNKVAGEFDRDGYSKTSFLVDCEVRLTKDTDIDIEGDDDVADRFGMRVMKSTERPGLEGKEWWGRTKKGVSRTGFLWLALQVFPESAVEDWT
jgi:hypothetical protein